MTNTTESDWNPLSEEVQQDQRAAYDRMRENCPVAYSEQLQWSLFRHQDITRVLDDHKTFSNAVSQHLSVPNGMDPPEHTAYRTIIEKYFSPQRMAAFEPSCRGIVTELLKDNLSKEQLELMADFARPFAVRAQCGFLGWPPASHQRLLRWTQKNHDATLTQDRQAMSAIAREFENLIDDLLENCLTTGAQPDDNMMAALMNERVWGRPLSNEEIASILRNWTVGEIGTIAASIGILVHFLALHPAEQQQLRANPQLLPAAIDEILRLHGPLVANRRITTAAVEIGGRKIAAGQRLSLNWIAANRDPQAFAAPDQFRLDRDPAKNLLYGAGIHVCPGAPLARLELRVTMEMLLQQSSNIKPIPAQPAIHAKYPASGFALLPVTIQ